MELHGHDVPLDGEGEKERLDRELSELLEEIRVALPGVQVLFAFLLALPFQAGWKGVTEVQREVYFASLCLALVASALLIAPSAYHRTNFRAYDKQRLIVLASGLTLAGITALGASMSGTLFVVADELFGQAQALVFSGLAGLLFVSLWGVLPWGDHMKYRKRAALDDPGSDR
ncbi:MAG: hypothetical protein JWL76_507 [Thermoleophilia bacterium]|nr:hypothetical protein [Thermoleophilia bacterium]